MKCPKCGYLGFEATDRCRNCGYNFSLMATGLTPDLALRTADPEGALADFPLLGGAEDAPVSGAVERGASACQGADSSPVAAGGVRDDLPLFAPRPAGTPLAVRRSTGEAPRPRRTTRPVRPETPSLPLLVDQEEPSPAPSVGASARRAATEVAGVGRRLGAAAIDLALLAVIDVAVTWLTLRLAGLQPTRDDLAVLPIVPMAGFFFVLGFIYLVGFALGGGQTIGKMIVGIRVTGDDGRGMDLTGAVVRALACVVMVGTLGLAYLPVVLAADRRGLHDRLAGTRVIRA